MNDKKLKALKRLRRHYKLCDKCPLCDERNRIVFGRGQFNKGIAVFGEAPGPTEDREGKPFMGRAGTILDKCLKLAKLVRNDTFIFNSVLCYPGRADSGGFNKPSEDEMICCAPRVMKTLSILKPKLIVVLGNCALFTLTNRQGIAANRGLSEITIAPKYETLIYVTYHPAALLRNNDYKEKAKDDWRKIGRLIRNGKRPKTKKRATKLL